MALMDEYGRAGGLLGAQPQTLSTNQQLLGVNVPGHAAHTASSMIPGTWLLDSLGFMMACPGVKW